MSAYIITGGAGMIGSNLVRRLVEQGESVILIDNFSRGRIDFLPNHIQQSGLLTIVELDLRYEKIPNKYLEACDYFVHLADIVGGIQYVFANQTSIFSDNLIINAKVIEAVKTHHFKNYLYVGTACSFPQSIQTGVHAEPMREEQQYPADPESAYGWSKLMGEYHANLMALESKIPVSILSLHNVYGHPCDFSLDTGQVIPALIHKVLKADEYIEVWGNGNQGRAFVHVEDVVDAILLAVDAGSNSGVIQIGPDHCTSINELAQLLIEISGKSLIVKHLLEKPAGDLGRSADYSKARKILGWAPKVELKDGLVDLFNWIRLNYNAQ
jgi:GDP-D-mannose 3', 5'-epimerase